MRQRRGRVSVSRVGLVARERASGAATGIAFDALGLHRLETNIQRANHTITNGGRCWPIRMPIPARRSKRAPDVRSLFLGSEAYSGCAAPAWVSSATAVASGIPFESIAPAFASASRSLSIPGCPTTNGVVRNAGVDSVTA